MTKKINGQDVNQFIMPFHCSKQLTGSVTALFAFQMPFAGKVLEVSAVARALGGTITTFTLDVNEAGTTILSSDMDLDVSAGVVVVGSVSDESLADNAKISVDVAIAGSSPTVDDLTVLVTLQRDD